MPPYTYDLPDVVETVVVHLEPPPAAALDVEVGIWAYAPVDCLHAVRAHLAPAEPVLGSAIADAVVCLMLVITLTTVFASCWRGRQHPPSVVTVVAEPVEERGSDKV